MGTPGEEQASPTRLLVAKFGLIIIKRGTQGEERVSGDGRRVQVMLPGDEAGGQESGWEEV